MTICLPNVCHDRLPLVDYAHLAILNQLVTRLVIPVKSIPTLVGCVGNTWAVCWQHAIVVAIQFQIRVPPQLDYSPCSWSGVFKTAGESEPEQLLWLADAAITMVSS